MGVAAGPGPRACCLFLGTLEGRQPGDPEQQVSRAEGRQECGLAGWFTVIGYHLDVTGPLTASVSSTGIKSLESFCVIWPLLFLLTSPLATPSSDPQGSTHLQPQPPPRVWEHPLCLFLWVS